MKKVEKYREVSLQLVVPLTDHPADNPPFKAILDAAGIPGVRDGRGRLTRKRFIRLVMSTCTEKREAEYLAWAANQCGVSYRKLLQELIVPAILHVEDTFEKFRKGELVQVQVEIEEKSEETFIIEADD